MGGGLQHQARSAGGRYLAMRRPLESRALGRPGEPTVLVMRVLVEGLLAIVFGLVGLAMVFQALGMLTAALAAFGMPGRPAAAPWVTSAAIQGALISGIFALGGFLLGALKLDPAVKRGSWRDVDESLPREWLWPAIIPMLLCPAVAVALSQNLFLLWRDILAVLRQLGTLEDFTRSDPFSGIILLPIFAVLFVPLLEALAAVFLVAFPPLLLVLLGGRSQRFRLNCQRLAVIQASFVGASLVGAHLFALLADRATPHIKATGGPEAPMVLEALARGREVLSATAMGYAAVVVAYLLMLWILMAVRVETRAVPEGIAEPMVPTPGEPPRAEEPAPVPDPPPTAAETFRDVLARYRARQRRGA